jgi:hypothetical protein
MKRTIRLLFGVVATAFLIGCENGCTTDDCPSVWLASPVEEVVAEYNANASRVPRLWAHAKISATLRERPGTLGTKIGSTSFLAGVNGRLLLRKTNGAGRPVDFMLRMLEGGEEIFRTGVSTNDEAYYYWTNAGERSGGQWGRLPLAGAPGVKIPIDPTQLLGVLGIVELPIDRTHPPFVAQRVTDDPCAYVLTYISRQPVTGKLLFTREIYFDRRMDQPRRPFMVKIFDDTGRIALTAEMADYQPIEMIDVPETNAPPPVMPTDIRLTWHQTGSEMHIVLPIISTADRVTPDGFDLWENVPDRIRLELEQVDEGIELPGVEIPRTIYRSKDIEE